MLADAFAVAFSEALATYTHRDIVRRWREIAQTHRLRTLGPVR